MAALQERYTVPADTRPGSTADYLRSGPVRRGAKAFGPDLTKVSVPENSHAFRVLFFFGATLTYTGYLASGRDLTVGLAVAFIGLILIIKPALDALSYCTTHFGHGPAAARAQVRTQGTQKDKMRKVHLKIVMNLGSAAAVTVTSNAVNAWDIYQQAPVTTGVTTTTVSGTVAAGFGQFNEYTFACSAYGSSAPVTITAIYK